MENFLRRGTDGVGNLLLRGLLRRVSPLFKLLGERPTILGVSSTTSFCDIVGGNPCFILTVYHWGNTEFITNGRVESLDCYRIGR